MPPNNGSGRACPTTATVTSPSASGPDASTCQSSSPPTWKMETSGTARNLLSAKARTSVASPEVACRRATSAAVPSITDLVYSRQTGCMRSASSRRSVGSRTAASTLACPERPQIGATTLEPRSILEGTKPVTLGRMRGHRRCQREKQPVRRCMPQKAQHAHHGDKRGEKNHVLDGRLPAARARQPPHPPESAEASMRMTETSLPPPSSS